MNDVQFNPIIAPEREQYINGVRGRYLGATMRENEKPGCFCMQRWGTSKQIKYNEKPCTIRVRVRWDDDCKNGHNSFSITGEINSHDMRLRDRTITCGCIHEEIAKYFPALEPLIKWHLFDSTGPMHYVSNTIYHADGHGPNRAWIYYTSPSDPLGLGKVGETCLVYTDETEARRAEGVPGYRVQWDEKTAKTRNLDAARRCAVWPEATDEQLCLPKEELEKLLLDRLPALITEFRTMIESCGFLWERVS